MQPVGFGVEKRSESTDALPDFRRYSPAYIVLTPTSSTYMRVLSSAGTPNSHASAYLRTNGIDTFDLQTISTVAQSLSSRQKKFEPLSGCYILSRNDRKKAFKALESLYDTADFIAQELVGSDVRGKLENMAVSRKLPSWVDVSGERTFFELQLAERPAVPQANQHRFASCTVDDEGPWGGIAVGICKVYSQGLLLYFLRLASTNSIFVTLDEGEDQEQPLLSMEGEWAINRLVRRGEWVPSAV
jgi:hypothetical protein